MHTLTQCLQDCCLRNSTREELGEAKENPQTSIAGKIPRSCAMEPFTSTSQIGTMMLVNGGYVRSLR